MHTSSDFTLTCLIVDDEISGRESLQELVQHCCPHVRIIGLAANAPEAIALIHKQRPDLVFLDIEMPKATGFDLLEAIGERDFEVIFTTAHDQYVIDAIRQQAIDYLLKPVNPKDLIVAVERTRAKRLQTQSQVVAPSKLVESPNAQSRQRKIGVPSEDGIVFLPLDEIVYLQSDGNYTNVHMIKGDCTLVTKQLKEFEDTLAELNFFRVHKSFLVNLDYVSKYVRNDGRYLTMENQREVPVSRQKKEELLKRLNEI